MNLITRILLIMIFLGTMVSNAQSQEAPSATVDFSSLNGLIGTEKRGVRLIAKSDSVTFVNLRVVFDLGKDVGKSVCECFYAAYEGSELIFSRKDSKLIIEGFRDKKGIIHPVREIRVTSEGEYGLAFVPVVTTTGKVKITRDADLPR
jgi:hypothetical protein